MTGEGRRPGKALVSLAWRESRSTRRRLLLYMSSISLGVAALVAIDSYASNITRSVRNQARTLFGGDVALSPRGEFTPAADSLLDSLTAAGTVLARETTFGSMTLAPRSGGTRLSQVHAVTDGFPLYGGVETQPASAWSQLHENRVAVVDPSLLIALNAQVGDSLQIGYTSFVINGTLTSVPGDAGFASTFGPRVYISDRFVGETRLLTFGSRADYDAFVRLPAGTNPETWLQPLRARFDSVAVRARTVSQRESSLTESIDQLSDFLGIVGLIALLLGGVGVASGVNAWIARKIEIVAVLRCLGATTRQVMLMYAVQAAVMGLVGAAAGAALGVLIQFALPGAIGEYLPVDVETRLEPLAIVYGLLLGVWIALAFSLRPLVAIRRISPLQAIRSSRAGIAAAGGRDWALIGVNAFIAATVIGISATRSRSFVDVMAFSGGIAAVVVLLWLAAVGLSRAARATMRTGWPYVVRQGVANLYRPANQTRAVVLSLGFGAFLVSTLYLVQANLLQQLQISQEASRGNLILFDVQEDQARGVDSLVRVTPGAELLQRTPIVTMRISAINGEQVRRRPNLSPVAEEQQRAAEQRDRREEPRGVLSWAARREYRSTYRDSIAGSERMIAGKWFGQSPARPGEPPDEVSLELSIAEQLGVTLGDVITWDVQGAPVATRITSLREVNWARFETNFYAVFPTTTLEKAPQTFVVIAAAPGDALGQVQRAVVQRYPNVAGIDLTLIRKTIGEISRRATLAIRFLTLFSLAMGVPVLFSAVAATRRERVREGVLLKTLGATRRQIGRILLSEYALLGLLGALSGMVLSMGGAWAIMKWVFDRSFTPAMLESAIIAGAMTGMAIAIGMLSGRDVFRETPMAALREG